MRRLFYSVIFLCALFSIHNPVLGQSFTLLRDLNIGPGDVPDRPQDLTGAGGFLYFTIKSGPTAGVWKTDGTEAGTILLKAVSAPESLETLVKLNSLSFFTVYNSGNATTTLWKTDGTVVGTILLQSLPGARIISPVISNGELFFVVNTGSSYELWKSNGTPGGVTILLNGATAIEKLTDVNGTLFFTEAESLVPYHRLWKSNGTALGTVLVKDIFAAAGNPSFFILYNANGTLLFKASDGVNGDELWKSDGSAAGTALVKDILPGNVGSNISDFVIANNIIYFFATTTGNSRGLWTTDGTGPGTLKIADLQADLSNRGPANLTAVNGLLYFQGYDNTHGFELWKSDGTAAGTIILKDIIAGTVGGSPNLLFDANGILYFASEGGTWKSDGTELGTVLVKDGYQQPLLGGAIGGFGFANGITFYSAYDPQYGFELWKTDGTTGGSSIVKNISSSPSSSPQNFVAANGIVYFSALNYFNSPTPQLGRDINQTDGTFAGTMASAHISSQVASTPLDMASHNGELFFSGHTNNDGYELYKISSNGGPAIKVKNINTYPIIPALPEHGSNPDNLLSIGQFLFFSADDENVGNELWKTDGTEIGTVLVKDINATGASDPQNLVNVNGTLYFTADNGTDGIELWKSDGTTGGTILVKNINAVSSSNPTSLTAINGVLYFSADDGVNGIELWKSDGTQAGTVLVKNINTASNSNPASLTNVNGVLYFSADDGISGVEAWKSDGSIAGTVLLKDIHAGPLSSNPSLFTDYNGTALFAADDGLAGRELWGSDGTAVGTVLVKDIQVGTSGSNPTVLKKIGNNILFAANDGIRGNEVWFSNGTELGTRLLGEIQLGVAGSDPTEFFEYGTNFLVAATNDLVGSEIWISEIPVGGPLPLDLLEFKGTIADNDGLLQWKTENENGTASFIIERSLDGRNYSSIGSVSAANLPGINYYDYKDVNILSLSVNVIYYRLKQTDIDGKYKYSNIVVLSVNNKKSIIMLYPNPAKDKLNMTITVAQHEKLQWQLTDNTGRTMKSGMYSVTPGSTTVSIDIANLGAGIYLMQLKGTTVQKVFKVVKQ